MVAGPRNQFSCLIPNGSKCSLSRFFCQRQEISINLLLSRKGVGDRNAPNLLAILKAFTVKNVTFALARRRDNQRIVPGQPKPTCNPQRFSIQGWRGVHRQEWTKRGRQILFRVCTAHWFCEAAQRNIKKLLHHLIADNAPARLDCLSDQLRGLRSLLR